MAEKALVQHVDHAFGPVFDARSRVLVLGSFPSVISRAHAFYYGNAQNRFWRVLAALTGDAVPPVDDVPGRRALLLRHGVALWDVVASCDIRGSSDASIKNVVPVDVGLILDAAPVEAVLCNGGTAARLYHRWLEPQTGRPADAVLPSTSPANASWSLERLVARWGAVLGPHLR